MSTVSKQCYTVDQYQQYLLKSEQRLEYYFGEIFAMPGGTPSHAQISTNIVRNCYTCNCGVNHVVS